MTKERPRSKDIFKRAEKLLVGGVNSPVRAFRAVGGAPLALAKGAGARVWDADGHAYIDYVCSWGALIFGHAHPAIAEAISDQARKGTSFGITIGIGSGIGGAHQSRDAQRGENPVCEQRDGSDHERGPAGARIYGARAVAEI